MTKELKVPKHVAIIMDGNGRWAKDQRLPRIEGHREGKNTVLKIVDASIDANIQVLTLFAFSTENWSRPADEVDFLFRLLSSSLMKESHKLSEKNIKLRFIGRRDRLNKSLLSTMEKVENQTKDNSGLILNIAIDFGGKWDIDQAANNAIKEALETGKSSLDEDVFEKHLSLAEMPPVDVFIRTGDVCRISNFLLWDIAYAELFFVREYWPAFSKEQYIDILEQFAHRERRFGMISEQLETV
ncbi:MAG: di-trans,poly-cis-decaprenylcistransferase [Legionellales bacterium]|nr:di-trans,poly-cis-decaprenylcistransferase [Legionellales bacterium]|tara:strand:+ start:786 stop:1511 length:726 start_codon:yes stop_codon:yes gene_type:complete